MSHNLSITQILKLLRDECFWTAGVFYSWTEGRGARAFKNSSIKSIDGEFSTKDEALRVARKAIEDRSLHSIHWETALPSVNFHIPHRTAEKLGEMMEVMTKEVGA